MSDPVSTVERALAERWDRECLMNNSDPEVDALTALGALHAAGWRIVRLEECEDGPCEVGDEPDEYPQHIVDEWTPAPADAAERTR